MSNATKMAELLAALNSGDNSKRQMAETMFQQAKASEPDNLLLGFVAVLEEESIPMPVRTQGAVLLRQMVSRGSDKDFVFSRAQPVHKQTIAAHLLSRFEAIEDPKLQTKVGDVIFKLADTACDEDDQRGWLAPGQRGWPQVLPTVFRLANAADATNKPTCCESSIRLLANLVAVFKDEIVQAQQQLGGVVQAALASPVPKVRCAAFVLVCELVGVLEKKAWAPLMATAGVLTSVLQQLGQANLQEELEECLQQYLEVASLQPDFFKSQLQQGMEPATTLATFVKTRSGVEEGIRKLALEWLVTYAEQKPKWLAKSLPAFIPLTLECCFHLMMEIQDGEAELKEWAERMDDEEGEEDQDELYHEGESAIDRLVEALTIDAAGTALFALVGKFSGQQEWQARLAALTAVKQTVEYVEAEHITDMAKLLLVHLDHPHPRVRYTALHALGQLSNDQAPHFQDTWHQTVMPVLLQKMDDPLDRVASMAMSAFVSFGEELENALMIQYSGGFMQKLVNRLQTSKHRMVQEESITSIAVIAGVIEKDFSQYYDGIMPLLKQLVLNAKGEKENRLRGKAFECMSLLGLAVGKEKFLPDAREAVGEMLKTPLEADDLQREYIQEASERICKCLKQDFAPFLPHLLPGIFASLKMEAEDASNQVATDQEDMEYITVSTGEGKLVKVRTSKFVEMEKGAQLLNTYCVEMEGAFYDCIQQTAEALLPLLSGSDEISMLCNEARNAAFQTWASLIKCARCGAKDRGIAPTVAAELLRTFLQRAVSSMQSDDDPEGLQAGAEGLAECLRNVGPGVLGPNEVTQLVEQTFKFIDESFKRTQIIEKEKQASSVGAPPELAQDDDEEDAGEEEEACRRAFEDALGAVMEVSPQEFLPCMTETCKRMQQWLSVPQHRTLALFLACDMLQHLKEHSEPAWPVFMDAVFQALGDKNPDVRIPAAFAISLAAPIPNFSKAAPQAFTGLAALLNGPAPKKKDEQAKVALDNCVSAMFALAKEKPQFCPPEIPAWQLVVSKLPLRDDEDEAKKIHKAVSDLLLEQHSGLLGPDNCHIGKVLSCLAEVYKQETLCTKETDAQILRIFQMLPRENLQQLAAGFSEKQQKKIEKMLTS